MKKVKISYACPIKWDDMQDLDDKSKFCGSCKMKVQDFSKDTELDTAGVHCGRFRMDQVESINRTFNFDPRQVFVVSLFSLLGMTTPLAAQSNIDSASTGFQSQQIKQQSIILTGYVKDSSTNEGIPFANVIIKDPDGGVITGGSSDIDGRFTITVSRELLSVEGVVVQVSVIGYGSKTLAAPEVTSETLKLDISLSASASEMTTGIVILGGLNAIDPDEKTTFDNEDHKTNYRQ